MTTTTAAQLRRAELNCRRTGERLEALRQERNRLVREALEEGWSHGQIADATGLSRGRIGQIAMVSD